MTAVAAMSWKKAVRFCWVDNPALTLKVCNSLCCSRWTTLTNSITQSKVRHWCQIKTHERSSRESSYNEIQTAWRPLYTDTSWSLVGLKEDVNAFYTWHRVPLSLLMWISPGENQNEAQYFVLRIPIFIMQTEATSLQTLRHLRCA